MQITRLLERNGKSAADLNMFSSGLDLATSRTHVLNMFRNDVSSRGSWPASWLAGVIGRRIARTWAGGVLLLGAGLLFLRCTLGSEHGMSPALIVLGTWFAAFVTYRFALACKPRVWAPDTLARASLIVPSLGILALLPLTLHLPFFALADSLDDFAGWVAISALVTAPTTIVAGILIAVRCCHLAEGRAATGVLSPAAIYGIGIAACGPFLLLVVPPILIALTGLPFLPLLAYQEKLVERERLIAEVGELPAALARFKVAA